MNNKTIRILIHTQYYPPEIGAPQNRLSTLASMLSNNGFQVTVLTAHPNYPTGKIYPGYGGLFRKEKDGNIEILRSWIYPTKSPSFIPRLFNYFSFILSSLTAGLFLPRFDYLLTESPPLFLGISGFILSTFKHARWIFNVSDLWPESVAELGLIDRASRTYRLSSRMEGFFYRKAWLVTGQSQAIIADIHRRYPEVLTYFLSNGINPELFLEESKPGKPDEVTVVYAGLHGLAQGLDQLIEAAVSFENIDNIRFCLIGDGPEKQNLIRMAKKNQATNVSFHNPVTKSEIPRLLNKADILVVPLKKQLTGAIPSKLYESMAAAKPVILIAENEAARIVNGAGCGIVVKPGDVQGIVNAIKKLAEDPETRKQMGENGYQAVVKKYNYERIFGEFSDYLRNRAQA